MPIEKKQKLTLRYPFAAQSFAHLLSKIYL